MVVDEELMVRVDIVVEINRKNDDLGHLLLQINERGKFFKTGSTPRRPEIEDYNFSAVVCEADRSCAVNDGEIWGCFCELCGVGAAITSR